MKRIALFLAVSACLSGCGFEASPAGTADRVANLEADAVELHTKIRGLELRLQAMEASEAVKAATPPVQLGRPGDWIAWERMEPNGKLGFSPAPPKPMDAFQTQSECLVVVEDYVKKNGGSADANSFTISAPGGFDTYTLTCLPKGVDPR